MDNPVSRPQTDVQALKRAARLLRVHVRTKEGDDLAVKLETLAAPADSTARPSYTKTEQDLWLALGKWSIEICRPDAELAPPRYLIDAVRDLSAQPAEEALAELVACKDLKDRLDAPYPRLMGEDFVKADEEYTRRKPLAWKAARAALAAPSPPPTKGD